MVDGERVGLKHRGIRSENKMKIHSHEENGASRLMMRHEIAPTVVLCIISAILFAATTLLSRRFEEFRVGLAHRWFTRGEVAMQQNQPAQASSDFGNALFYNHENREYTFRLAQSLSAAHYDAQALPYFSTLWESEPGNGAVNLELARLQARNDGTDKALRYFHSAIYGEWQSDQQENRRLARLELIGFLMDRGLKQNAEAELIGLEAELPEDHSMDSQVAGLFLQTGDYGRALNLYRSSLEKEPLAKNFAGAGLAAFKLGDYADAKTFLARAFAEGNTSDEVRERLDDADEIEKIDPYLAHITTQEKSQRIFQLFNHVGDRLKNCKAAGADRLALAQAKYEDWKQLQKRVSVRNLHESPDLDDEVMSFAFNAAKLTSSVCGAGAEEDSALLTIAQSHPGVAR